MQFKVDENLPSEIAERLRQHGHDALSVSEQPMGGSPDVQVAAVCQAEARALVTLDLDFSDIRAYPPQDYHGIIVLRPAIQNVTTLIRLMNRVLPLFNTEPLEQHLWIADEHQVRNRGAEGPGSPGNRIRP